MKTSLENVRMHGVLTLDEARPHILDNANTDPVSVGFEYDEKNPFEVVAVGDDSELMVAVGERLGLEDPQLDFKSQTTVNSLFKALRKISAARPAALMVVNLELTDPEVVRAEYQLPFFGTTRPTELASISAEFTARGESLKREFVPKSTTATIKMHNFYRTPQAYAGEPKSITTSGRLTGRYAGKGTLGTG